MSQIFPDPVPGGCNLSFPTEYAPYQLVSYTDELIIVQSQPPSMLNSNCDKNGIQVEMYHLYLHENNYDSYYYFWAIESMLTVDLIRAKGVKIPTVEGYFKYRKLYATYRGVGQVFAIVATYGNTSSAYVPAVSYGCDLTEPETCTGPVTPHWKLICAFLAIFGLFVCHVGHRFLRITLYLVGCTLGIFVTYVILSLSTDSLTVEGNLCLFFYLVFYIFCLRKNNHFDFNWIDIWGGLVTILVEIRNSDFFSWFDIFYFGIRNGLYCFLFRSR